MPKSKSKKEKKSKSEAKKVEKLDDDSISPEEEIEQQNLEEPVEDDTVDEEPVEEQTDGIKQVFTFNDDFDKLVKLKESEVKTRNDRANFIKDHQKIFDQKMKEFSNLVKTNKKDQEVIFKKLRKLHNNEVKKASKEKRKRNGENTGGFNSKKPVPKKLREFLEIEEESMLNRPSVFHLMSEKFKQLGLKKGQDVILDKKSAKKLGKPNGLTIPFAGQQPFIASFYKEEKELNVEV